MGNEEFSEVRNGYQNVWGVFAFREQQEGKLVAILCKKDIATRFSILYLIASRPE
jgi:hypothetical protein